MRFILIVCAVLGFVVSTLATPKYDDQLNGRDKRSPQWAEIGKAIVDSIQSMSSVASNLAETVGKMTQDGLNSMTGAMGAMAGGKKTRSV